MIVELGISKEAIRAVAKDKPYAPYRELAAIPRLKAQRNRLLKQVEEIDRELNQRAG